MAERPKPVAVPDEEELLPSEGEAFGSFTPETEQPEEKKEKPETPASRLLNTREASSRAFVKGQADDYQDSIVFDTAETKLFDLSDPDQLANYNRVSSENLNPDLGLTINFEDLKFSEKTGSWLVLVQMHHYKFLPIA